MNSFIDMLPSTLINAIVTLLFGAVVFLAGILARWVFSQVKKEYLAIKAALMAVDTKLDLATSNHLHTIQDNTGRTVSILENMQKDQSELIGYLRGKL